ncbi:MAG TPA: carbon-nitrogen hydrolase family protein [Woeseiaceae bacterium]|nr:carbon-nitrogen hydrolase family protein [Woeseiaceae bacterium]
MVPFSIAGIQTHVAATHSNVDALLQKLDLTIAHYPWVQMVLLSELASFGPLTHHAQPPGGPAENAYRKAAAKHGIWLLPGSLYETAADGRIYNTMPVINPQGDIVARCTKLFPFLPYEINVTAGSEFCVFDIPEVGRFAASICYDIWFPETTRALTAMGAEVLLHPVLTGTVDREIELAIARATAAQFQCFVFDVNGLGAGGVGRSAVVDPSGVVLYQAGGSEETIPIEINLEQVRRQRETGLRGLGQPLKSFRDSQLNFPIYDPGNKASSFLATLGPLELPQRGSRAGIGAPAPPNLENLPEKPD